MIKVSIIVPIYGVESYLRKCVDSLLMQDLPATDYEIILVDDESPDLCPQICDEYATAYDNIRVIHRKNGGLSAARNSGLEIAQGEYLMFVDSDDYIELNVLSGLMAQVERDNLDVLRYRLQYVNPHHEVYNPYKSDPFKSNDYSEAVTDGITFLNTRMNTQCYAWQFLLRRDLIVSKENSNLQSEISNPKNILFKEKIYFEDTDWTPRMLVKAERVASSNTVVYSYLQREGSITNAVNRAKQKKILDDKIRLISEMQRQAKELQAKGLNNAWFNRMIADTVISVVGILSVDFYPERKIYLAQLKQLDIWPLHASNYQSKITNYKLTLINLSPRLAVELLHWRNAK